MMCMYGIAAAPALFGLAMRILYQPHRRGLELLVRLLQSFGDSARSAGPADLPSATSSPTSLKIGLDGAATVARQLAADQVHRLHTIGALIDHGDARIADLLLDTGLGDVAVAAEDLLRQDSHVEALVRTVALDHRCQQFEEILGRLPLFRVGRREVREVDLQRNPECKRAQALGVSALPSIEHAADIRVHEQGVGRLVGLGGAGERPALASLHRVAGGILVSEFGLTQSLQTDAEPGPRSS